MSATAAAACAPAAKRLPPFCCAGQVGIRFRWITVGTALESRQRCRLLSSGGTPSSSSSSASAEGSGDSGGRGEASSEAALKEAGTPVNDYPTRLQMKRHFITSAVPLVGFGFMDNTVMIHAGNAIDLTLGVTFGLSTLAAAACGQICSDIAGVTFGGLIDAAGARLGLPSANFTEEQRRTPVVKRVGLAGSLIGVFCGCSLGLVNLLLIDTNRARQLKLAAGMDDGPKFAIAMNNEAREGMTAITIDGPDTAGVIASVTTAMAVAGCKIQEMSGDRSFKDGQAHMSFTFYLTKGEEQIEDEELEQLGLAFVEACNHPQRIRTLHSANEALQKENDELREKITDLDVQLRKAHASLNKASLAITRRVAVSKNDDFDFEEFKHF